MSCEFRGHHEKPGEMGQPQKKQQTNNRFESNTLLIEQLQDANTCKN